MPSRPIIQKVRITAVLGLWPHRMFGGTQIMLRAPCDFLHIADETVYMFAMDLVELFNAIDSSQLPAAFTLLPSPGRLFLGKKRVIAFRANPVRGFSQHFRGDERQSFHRLLDLQPDIQPHGNPLAPGASPQHPVVPLTCGLARHAKYKPGIRRVPGTGHFPLMFLIKHNYG